MLSLATHTYVRSLNKIICLVLALVLLVGSSISAFAEKKTDYALPTDKTITGFYKDLYDALQKDPELLYRFYQERTAAVNDHMVSEKYDIPNSSNWDYGVEFFNSHDGQEDEDLWKEYLIIYYVVRPIYYRFFIQEYFNEDDRDYIEKIFWSSKRSSDIPSKTPTMDNVLPFEKESQIEPYKMFDKVMPFQEFLNRLTLFSDGVFENGTTTRYRTTYCGAEDYISVNRYRQQELSNNEPVYDIYLWVHDDTKYWNSAPQLSRNQNHWDGYARYRAENYPDYEELIDGDGTSAAVKAGQDFYDILSYSIGGRLVDLHPYFAAVYEYMYGEPAAVRECTTTTSETETETETTTERPTGNHFDVRRDYADITDVSKVTQVTDVSNVSKTGIDVDVTRVSYPSSK